MGDEVKHVQLRLDVDAYDILKSEAIIAGLTPASLLKKIALAITATKSTANYEISDFNFQDNSEKLNVKVSMELKEKLQREAARNGWSLSKESRFRLASSLTNAPAFYPDEVA